MTLWPRRCWVGSWRRTPRASEAWLGLLACMRGPVPVTYLPHRIMVRGAPPILLVGSTHDPETNTSGRTNCAARCPAPCCSPATATVTPLVAAEQPDERRDRALPHRTPDTPAEHRLPRLRAETGSAPALRLAVTRSCGHSRSAGQARPLATDLQPAHERQTNDDEFVTIDMDDQQQRERSRTGRGRASAWRLAVSIGLVGDVRCGGDGPADAWPRLEQAVSTKASGPDASRGRRGQ
jgi:hypothetical protein